MSDLLFYVLVVAFGAFVLYALIQTIIEWIKGRRY